MLNKREVFDSVQKDKIKKLEEISKKDLPTLVFTSMTTEYLAEVVKLIYNESSAVKFKSSQGTNLTPMQYGGTSTISASSFVTEGAKGEAPFPQLYLACTVVPITGDPINLFKMNNQVGVIQITRSADGGWEEISNISFKDIFDAAGLTVEDFLRKFVPDSPYLK